MRVRVSANPPLPPVRAWFPLNISESALSRVSSLKASLCSSIPAFRSHCVAPAALRLSIDGFELLDDSELSVVRDGDLICVDAVGASTQDQSVSRVVENALGLKASRKRKRRMSSTSSSSDESDTGSESDSESETDTEESDSDSGSSSNESPQPTAPPLRVGPPRKVRVSTTLPPLPSRVVDSSTFVPPGYGKPQTRSRNMRRRLKRVHQREAAEVLPGGPVSGANAVVGGERGATTPAVLVANRGSDATLGLMSLSLRNKNKAKNFKSLMGKALPPKIIFGDQDGGTSESVSDAVATPACRPQVLPRLVPPSSRASLPPNVFVTSIDVEAGLRRERKEKMRVESRDAPEEQAEDGVELEADIGRLEAIADRQWDTLEKPSRERGMKAGTVVGFRGLGINPVTHTPGQVVTVARVVSCEDEGVVVQPLRAVSFGGPVDGTAEWRTWAELERGDWHVIE